MRIYKGTESDYRNLDALSQSDAKWLLKNKNYFENRHKLNVETEAMRFGKAVHMAALEPTRFKELYVTAPNAMPDGSPFKKGSKNTTIYKDMMKDFESKNLGKVIINEEGDYSVDTLTGILNALSQDELAASLLIGGEPEVRVLSTYRETEIKGTVDYYLNHSIFGPTVVELKTTKDATEDSFTKEVGNRLYDFQQSFYRLLFPNHRHIVIAVENREPFSVEVYDIEPWMDLGLIKVNRAFDRLKDYQNGYKKTIKQLVPTAWAVNAENENIE